MSLGASRMSLSVGQVVARCLSARSVSMGPLLGDPISVGERSWVESVLLGEAKSRKEWRYA